MRATINRLASIRRLGYGLMLGCAVVVGAANGSRATDAKPHAFEMNIQRFEARDREMPPPENPILFVGSSSIRLWDVGKSFPGLNVINRGFGGSKIADSVYFAERIVINYKPKAIVFFAGDNDLASGKSPEEVAADFRKFVVKIHAMLPATPIVLISINPSVARWKLIDKQREANRLIADFMKPDSRLKFIDVRPSMLDSDGKPRAELFIADGMHMNAKGYELWAAQIAPILNKVK
jgi:lysophospholipase L1-like esterase